MVAEGAADVALLQTLLPIHPRSLSPWLPLAAQDVVVEARDALARRMLPVRHPKAH